MVDPSKSTQPAPEKKPAELPKVDALEKSKKAELKDPHFKIIKGPIKGQKSVVLHASAYKSVVLYASRYANPTISPAKWKEIYGIMIGTIDNKKQKVIVTRCEPLTPGEDIEVHLQDEHYTQIAEIDEKLFNEGKGEFVVGWWHSHPGLSLFYSDTDLRNQMGFQNNNPDACGLVFDHTLIANHQVQDRPLGFEIFRITDPTMDAESPAYADNYNLVAWEIEGMDEYFFANVLAELSAKYTAGKPLEMSYGEKTSDKKKVPPIPAPQKITPPIAKNSQEKASTPLLQEIPLPAPPINPIPQDSATQLVMDGKAAFESGDSFTGSEKYKQAIEILVKAKRKEELVKYLADVAALCVHSGHFPLVKDFGRKLLKFAEDTGSLVHMAQAHYFQGVAFLREKEHAEKGLEELQQAEISFEKSGEFALAGLCNQLMGENYLSQQNFFSAALFYIEAIKFYSQGRQESLLLQKLAKLNSGNIERRVVGLGVDVRKFLEKLTDPKERDKIESELKKLKL